MAKFARGGIAATVGLTAAVSGMTVPARASMATAKRPSPDVVAAEAVARPVVVGFESLGSDAAASLDQLRALATTELAAQLDRPSDGGSGAAEEDAGLTVTAAVDRLDVVSSGNGVVELLATTTLHVRTDTDTATTPRLVPVRVVSTPAG